jgi:hypothetical protein
MNRNERNKERHKYKQDTIMQNIDKIPLEYICILGTGRVGLEEKQYRSEGALGLKFWFTGGVYGQRVNYGVMTGILCL